ncbi:MAG: type II toxin-antitoxin system HicA family toxin [Polyangia bacterium]
MSQLPQVSGVWLVRAMERAGVEQLRQMGSHVTLRHRSDLARRATVPVHPSRGVAPGTLRSLPQGASFEVDELRRLL